MLWFCFASDGTPTWYVGKEEEFGQARGWLQVKSDAQVPHEIKGPWSVWSGSERRCETIMMLDIHAAPPLPSPSAQPQG